MALDQNLLQNDACLALQDTGWIVLGPKVKIIPSGKLAVGDTNLPNTPYPISIETIPLCEMDFCNPLTYAGLGPDINTCADSLSLQGAIVYPGQKLEWSTGDSTLSLKVPVGQQPKTISIKISGICGTFEDTIQIVPSQATAVSFNQPDSLLNCKPILLNPQASVWQNPVWQTPKGIVSNQTSLLADTSGYYIIQNGEVNCERRDSVYVTIRPTSQPRLNLSDTIRSCLPVSLQASANQWATVLWSTPQGNVSGQTSLLANLSGKYRVQNEQLGCAKADSVFVLIRSPFSVSIQSIQDSIFTCKPVSLQSVASKRLGFQWLFPAGSSNQNQILASQTGWFIAQNDTGNCRNQDSIFVSFKDTASVDFILQAGGRTLLKLDTLVLAGQLPISLNAITQAQATLFRWYLDGILQAGNAFTQTFNLPDEGIYSMKLLTTSSDSCLAKAEKEFRLRKQNLPPIEIPSMVTQNKDNKNDFFEMVGLSFFPQNQLEIFNRWGQKVFSASPYQNNWPENDTLEGTYFYRLVAGGKQFNGWVQVLK